MLASFLLMLPVRYIFMAYLCSLLLCRLSPPIPEDPLGDFFCFFSFLAALIAFKTASSPTRSIAWALILLRILDKRSFPHANNGFETRLS